jgi:hypothetical protein
VRDALPAALRTIRWLLTITIPVSFGVLLLKLTGALPLIAHLCEPLFRVIGLPGEAAVVFVTACLLNIYSCIVVIETLGLAGRTVIILALMCLISHNLPVESAVQRKAGSRIGAMLLVRLAASFAGACALNLLLPADAALPADGAAQAWSIASWTIELKTWATATSILCAKIFVLITVLMILERVLDEFGITRLFSRLMKYPLLLLGLPEETAFLWVVANTLGLAYGAGIIVNHIERGQMSRDHADLLNHHVAISHSLLEDTLLFVAIGVPAAWIIFPRLVLAGFAVWVRRLLNRIQRKAEPAGGTR